MKLKDIIKKQTLLIILTVAIVAATTIGISYAVFFDVKSNSKDQEVTAGTLKVKLSDFSVLNLTEPLSEADGLQSEAVKYTVQNTDSSLPASYNIYIYEDTDNTINLNKVRVSTNGTTSFILGAAETLEENGKTYYKIDSGNVEAGASSAEKSLRVWVDSALLDDGVEETVSLSLYIVSEVAETTSTATIE